MLFIVAYDVNTESESGKSRLRRVAKECVNYGQRVQNSVFECSLDASQYKRFKESLRSLIDEKTDSLRFYNMGNRYDGKIECIGKKRGYKAEDVLII